MTSRIAVIINPVAGIGWRLDAVRARVELVRARLAAHGLTGDVVVSERAGHACDLARAAVDGGARLVFAWGGDGTVNEIGRALCGRDASLAIVPGGSGNGLARELGVSFRPVQAIEEALAGSDRVIDAGELDGRLFFNVAGVGLDAEVAARFQARRRRGLVSYVATTLAVLAAHAPVRYRVTAPGCPFDGRALLIALANSRQYGSGAVIAPGARLDDGRLDLVIVGARAPLSALFEARRLFRGTVAQAPGVRICRFAAVTIDGDEPFAAHVDGEPLPARTSVTARVRPGALRVRMPGFVRLS